MSSVFLLSSSFADIHEAVGSRSLLNHSGYQQPDLVVELHLCSLVSILQKHEFEKNTRLFNGAAATYPDTVLVSRVDYVIKNIGLIRHPMATTSWCLQGTSQSHGEKIVVIGIGPTLKKQGCHEIQVYDKERLT
ncbi:hypothetical protein Tco_0573523 [Tanacetum coccineum]